MIYLVGVTVHNTFEVEASSIEQAEQQILELNSCDILNDADFNVTYVDKLTKASKA